MDARTQQQVKVEPRENICTTQRWCAIWYDDSRNRIISAPRRIVPDLCTYTCTYSSSLIIITDQRWLLFRKFTFIHYRWIHLDYGYSAIINFWLLSWFSIEIRFSLSWEEAEFSPNQSEPRLIKIRLMVLRIHDEDSSTFFPSISQSASLNVKVFSFHLTDYMLFLNVPIQWITTMVIYWFEVFENLNIFFFNFILE